MARTLALRNSTSSRARRNRSTDKRPENNWITGKKTPLLRTVAGDRGEGIYSLLDYRHVAIGHIWLLLIEGPPCEEESFV